LALGQNVSTTSIFVADIAVVVVVVDMVAFSKIVGRRAAK
jgi:hypothetical protein